MIFVQAVDGKYYINPKIGGKSWYLDFTDDGVFVRVKKYGSTNPDSAATRARRLLKEHNVKAAVSKYTGEDTVLFPPKFDCLENAVNFCAVIKAPIPIPETFDEVVSTPVIEHPMLAWKMKFPKQVLRDAFNEKLKPNLMLIKFLTGESMFRRSEMGHVREALMRYLPGIKRFRSNPDKWFENQPDEIVLET